MKNLLEKEIIQMLQLTAALLEEHPLSIKKAAATLQVSVRTIRRLLASQLNEAAFFDYQITNGTIYGVRCIPQLKRNQPNAMTVLLRNSHRLSLLILIIERPALPFSLLSDCVYISTMTLHRRFDAFHRFLSPFSLTIDRKGYPFITGNERQIRYLLFKLTVGLNASLCDSPTLLYQHFLAIHTLRQQAFYRATSCIDSGDASLECYIPDYYLTSEAAYLFLWKQLLSLETFFVPTHEATLIKKIVDSFVLSQDEPLETNKLSHIYQIHLVCALLEGNIFVLPPVVDSFSPITVRLIRCFLLQLPHYEKLLKKHPELPMLYECMWQKQSIFHPIFTIKHTPTDH